MDTGWVKIHRSLLEWEWYGDTGVTRLFLHILLKANFEPKRWRGIIIKRGQLITSLNSLAEETTLSAQQVRTALTKLISTNEITNLSTPNYRLLTVNKYEDYQAINEQLNKRATNEQQTSNKRETTTKNIKNDKNDKNKETSYDVSTPTEKKTNLKTKPIKEWTEEEKDAHATTYLIRCYVTLYQRTYQTEPVVNYAQFGARLKDYLAQMTRQEILDGMMVFFTLDDEFITSASHSFALFCTTETMNKIKPLLTNKPKNDNT